MSILGRQRNVAWIGALCGRRRSLECVPQGSRQLSGNTESEHTPWARYLDAITDEEEESEDEEGEGGEYGSSGDDLYDQAVAVVLRDRKASTSYVQRRLGIGYNRAASLVERMEKEGLIGAANHSGKREILVGGDDAERPY